MMCKKRTHPIDSIEDLWTIFECPRCGVLFFGEEKVQEHLGLEHNVKNVFEKPFSVELIRAIPQDEARSKS